MKRYNTPHRHRVIKTRLTEEEYTEFSEHVTLCKMSQAEFIRQALIKSRICPVITVSPVNDELLSAVGKLTAEYGKIGGNLNQIARCLNEYGAPYNALSQEVRAATAELAAPAMTRKVLLDNCVFISFSLNNWPFSRRQSAGRDPQIHPAHAATIFQI